MKEYSTGFFEWHGQSLLTGMDEFLNERSREGWRLFDLKPVSIGFLVIFERDCST